MILTTTDEVSGYQINKYLGIVVGEVIVGANVFRDLFARVRDITGGRTKGYEKEIRKARAEAVAEMVREAERLGANAIVGIRFETEAVSEKGSMFLCSVTGTAVIATPRK